MQIKKRSTIFESVKHDFQYAVSNASSHVNYHSKCHSNCHSVYIIRCGQYSLTSIVDWECADSMHLCISKIRAASLFHYHCVAYSTSSETGARDRTLGFFQGCGFFLWFPVYPSSPMVSILWRFQESHSQLLCYESASWTITPRHHMFITTWAYKDECEDIGIHRYIMIMLHQ